MDESELRRWVQAHTTRRIPKWVWDLLRDDGYLHADGEDERQELLSRTQRLLQIAPSNGRGAPDLTGIRDASAGLNRRESLRTLAASEHFAKQAEMEPDLHRSREQLLDKKLLTPDEAWNFLESPAAQIFSLERFLDAGVPPARHTSRIIREEAHFPASYTPTVRVEPAGIEWTEEKRGERAGWTPERALGDETIAIADGGRTYQFRCWNGSVHHDLQKVAEALERHHYPWLPGEAAWFVLTGVIPMVLPLSGTLSRRLGMHGNRVTFTITVEPWVSAETVVSFYRRQQQELLHRHNRPISELRLLLFRFVLKHADYRGELPTWRSMMAEWNSEYPDRNYKNVRNMARDYRSAARLVAFPRFGKIT